MDAIELFAGGGGLALGLHDAGFKPVAVVERDPASCRTLRKNWPDRLGQAVSLFDMDVRQVDFRQWQDRVELVSGGPRVSVLDCGKHRGHRDDRDMFSRAVEWFGPFAQTRLSSRCPRFASEIVRRVFPATYSPVAISGGGAP
jgi:DNA (cytosine-5)-methyltransferase 1